MLSEDKLFATLDPTTRALTLDDGQQILLTDTVGFIRKLPHNLVEAFKSTLEEAKYADYIIHVVDCSNPQAVQQMEVVYDTLQELGVQGKKTITLFNKVDVGAAIRMRDSMADHTLKVSAKTGEGLEDLKQLLGKILSEEQIYVGKNFFLSGGWQDPADPGIWAAAFGGVHRYWNSGESQSAAGNSWEAYVTQPDLWNWQKVWVYKVITFEDNK